MAVSTGNQRRRTEGREYDTPPPLPCTPKELEVLLDKWIADGIFKPNQVSREPDIGLKLGSIPTWDDMVDVFCTKYFHGEETRSEEHTSELQSQ